MPDLKPCPFCGRRDKLKVHVSTHTVGDSVYRQYTIFCDASGDKTGCGASCGYRRTRYEAVKAWNRRADKEAQEITEYISKKEAVSRISELLIDQLKYKRLPTWNEVYHAIND